MSGAVVECCSDASAAPLTAMGWPNWAGVDRHRCCIVRGVATARQNQVSVLSKIKRDIPATIVNSRLRLFHAISAEAIPASK